MYSPLENVHHSRYHSHQVISITSGSALVKCIEAWSCQCTDKYEHGCLTHRRLKDPYCYGYAPPRSAQWGHHWSWAVSGSIKAIPRRSRLSFCSSSPLDPATLLQSRLTCSITMGIVYSCKTIFIAGIISVTCNVSEGNFYYRCQQILRV